MEVLVSFSILWSFGTFKFVKLFVQILEVY